MFTTKATASTTSDTNEVAAMTAHRRANVDVPRSRQGHLATTRSGDEQAKTSPFRRGRLKRTTKPNQRSFIAELHFQQPRCESRQTYRSP